MRTPLGKRCPTCTGAGTKSGHTCPACGGSGTERNETAAVEARPIDALTLLKGR
jgi:DnaJ-class molecular chaperone